MHCCIIACLCVQSCPEEVILFPCLALNITQCSKVKLVQSSKMALNTCHDLKKQRCVKRTTRTRAKRLQAENTTAQIQGCKKRDQPSNLTVIDEPQVKRQRIQFRPKKSRPSKLSPNQPVKCIYNGKSELW